MESSVFSLNWLIDRNQGVRKAGLVCRVAMVPCAAAISWCAVS